MSGNPIESVGSELPGPFFRNVSCPGIGGDHGIPQYPSVFPYRDKCFTLAGNTHRKDRIKDFPINLPYCFKALINYLIRIELCPIGMRMHTGYSLKDEAISFPSELKTTALHPPVPMSKPR